MSMVGKRLKFAIMNRLEGPSNFKQYSRESEIPYRTLQNYIRGERQPNVVALKKISKTGININWLLTGDGNFYATDLVKKEIVDKIFIILFQELKDIIFSNDSLLETHEKFALYVYFIRNELINMNDQMYEDSRKLNIDLTKDFKFKGKYIKQAIQVPESKDALQRILDEMESYNLIPKSPDCKKS